MLGWPSLDTKPEKNISEGHLETRLQLCVSVCVMVWEFLGSPKLSFEGIRKRRRQPRNSNPAVQRSGPGGYVCMCWGNEQ